MTDFKKGFRIHEYNLVSFIRVLEMMYNNATIFGLRLSTQSNHVIRWFKYYHNLEVRSSTDFTLNSLKEDNNCAVFNHNEATKIFYILLGAKHFTSY